MANSGRMVRHSAMVTMESLCRKSPSLFRMAPSVTPTTSDSPKMGVQKCTLGPSRRMLPPGEYDRSSRQGGCVLCQMY